MALSTPPGGMPQVPRWVPPGGDVPDNVWAYDFQRNGWVPPDEPIPDDRTILAMPIGWEPRGRDRPFQVVMSPPGVQAPMQAYSYTPKRREVHAPGTQAPVDETNLSLVPAGPPPGAGGPMAAAPNPAVSSPPSSGPPMVPPPSAPPSPPGAPPRPPAAGMRPGGGAPPPTGLPAPGPSPTPLGPPQMPPPTGMGQATPSGRGGPPAAGPASAEGAAPASMASLDPEQIARALLAEITGVGQGQGRAAPRNAKRVGVGAALPVAGDPAYVPGVSQNTLPTLTRAEAAAACGPAAALFMNAMGRPPTVEEAQTLRAKAIAAGWTPGAGMGGTGAFQRLARSMGIDVQSLPADHDRVRDAVQAGQPVVVSTPQHYWQITDYDPQTDRFVMGDAVGAGREMSLDEIRRHPRYGGGINGVFAAPAPGADQGGDARLLGTSGPPRTTNPEVAQGQRGLVQIGLDAGAPLDIATIMAASALTESSGNPKAIGDGGHSVGLWQMHDHGAGAGMSVEARENPDTAAQVMLPEFQKAYAAGQRQGLTGADLAAYTHVHAERPQDAQTAAQRFTEHYQAVSSNVARGQDVSLYGATLLPLQGGAQAAQTAQAQPVDQSLWDQARGVAQQAAQRIAQAISPAPAYAAEEGVVPSARSDYQEVRPPPRSIGYPNPMDPGNPIYQATVGPGDRVPPAPATASPAPAPASPALVDANTTADFTEPSQAQQAIGMTSGGVTRLPPRPPPPAAPPAPTPPREARPGYHFEYDSGEPVETPDLGYHPENGLINLGGDKWVQPSPTAQRPPPESQIVELGPGLRGLVRPDGTGTLYHTRSDGSTEIAQADFNSDTPPTAWAPISGPDQTPMTAYQQATLGETAQARQDRAQQEAADLAARIRTADLSDAREQEKLRQQADQFQQTLDQQREERATVSATDQARLNQNAQQYSGVSGSERLRAAMPAQVGGRLVAYRQNPDNPDDPTDLVPVDMGEVTPTVSEAERQREYDLNQTTISATDRARLGAPQVIGGGIFSTNPDTGELSRIGDVPMTAEAQATEDERKYEYANLSAEQQANLGIQQQDLSQRQQEAAQRHEEALLPYEKMTKAQEAQNQISQQQLGLQRQELAVTPEPLPRGGVGILNRLSGQFSIANPPEPEALQEVHGGFIVPAGRSLNIMGQQVSGGPNPYAAWGQPQWGAPQMQGGGMGGWMPPQMQGGGMGGWMPPQMSAWGGMGGGGMSGGYGGGGYGY